MPPSTTALQLLLPSSSVLLLPSSSMLLLPSYSMLLLLYTPPLSTSSFPSPCTSSAHKLFVYMSQTKKCVFGTFYPVSVHLWLQVKFMLSEN